MELAENGGHQGTLAKQETKRRKSLYQLVLLAMQSELVQGRESAKELAQKISIQLKSFTTEGEGSQ